MKTHAGSLDHDGIEAQMGDVRAAALPFDKRNEAVPRGQCTGEIQTALALGTAVSLPTTKQWTVGGQYLVETQDLNAADVPAAGNEQP